MPDRQRHYAIVSKLGHTAPPDAPPGFDVRRRVLSLAAPVPALLHRLELVQQRDDFVEVQLQAAQRKMTALMIALVICLMGGVFLASMLSSLIVAIIAFILVLLCLAGVIYWGMRMSAWAAKELSDRRLTFTRQVLTALGADMPGERACKLTVSFQDYRKHGRLKARSGMAFFGNTTQKYLDPWFELRCRLFDGNRVCLAVAQRITVQTRMVRKQYPGKIKWKMKTKARVREVYTLTLAIDLASYPGWSAQAAAFRAGEIAGLASCSADRAEDAVRIIGTTPLTRDRIDAVTGFTSLEESLSGHDVPLNMLMYVYSRLESCRPPGVQKA